MEYRRFFGDIDTPLYYFIVIMVLLSNKPFESQGKLNTSICYLLLVICYLGISIEWGAEGKIVKFEDGLESQFRSLG
jgi:hypothetical protein